jgi:hypothetical protein
VSWRHCTCLNCIFEYLLYFQRQPKNTLRFLVLWCVFSASFSFILFLKTAQEYKERRRLGGNREKETLDKLKKFQQALKGGGGGGVAATALSNLKDEDDPGPTAAAGAAANKDDEGDGGYDGRVRADVDHRQLMPAAWRVDSYLTEPTEEDGLEALRGHRLKFSGQARTGDDMARRESVDDYVVLDPLAGEGTEGWSRRRQGEKKRGTEWAGRARE